MSRPRKKCKFVDDEADKSGSNHEGDDDDGVQTQQDMDFLDDDPMDDDREDEEAETDLRKIKIRKCERKLSKEDYRVILENAGIKEVTYKKKPKKKKKQKELTAAKRMYKSTDDEDFNSADEGFVATSDDDDESDAGSEMQASIRNFVEREGKRAASNFTVSLLQWILTVLKHLAGILLGKKAAGSSNQHTSTLTAPLAKTGTVNFMNKDAFYLVTEDGEKQPASISQTEDGETAAECLPLSMRLGKISKVSKDAAEPAASAPSPPARKKTSGKGSFVRPMDAHKRKTAPMFLGQKSKMAPIFLGRQQPQEKPSKAGSAAPKVQTGIFWNSSEGKAYVRHKNGLTTPHVL